MAEAKRLRSEFVVGVSGAVERRSPDTVNPKLADRRGRGRWRARSALLNEAKTPPFPIADDTPVSEDVRLRTATSICAGRGCSTTSVLRHRVDDGDPQVLRREGLLEIETPILTKSTPEGARDYLVPSRVHPGRVLRAAAVAADLQADPDDRRHRPLLPDRALLPRRGPARRPAARVHAGRRRDVVRDGRSSIFGLIEPLMQRLFGAHRPRRSPTPFPPHAVRRGDREVRLRQAGPALRHGDPGPVASCSASRRSACSAADRRRRRRRCAASSCRAPRSYSRSELDELVDQAKQLGAAGLIWARRGEGGVQSSALEGAGRGRRSARRSTRPAPAPATCC